MSKKKLLRNVERVRGERLEEKINEYVWTTVQNGTEMPTFNLFSEISIPHLQVLELQSRGISIWM